MAVTERIAVLGGGSWGTALALHAGLHAARVSLWIRDPELAEETHRLRENRKYLPGLTLSAGVAVTTEMAAALRDASIVIVAVPSHHCRSVLARAKPDLAEGAAIVLASKGIEDESLSRMSQVARQALSPISEALVAVLSGPSFAREVASGQPTAIVAAAQDARLAARVQLALGAGNLRVYTNSDVIGVEMGGALKNVIAIGAGVAEGLGYGSNTTAAIITRGLAEISRLAERLGGRRETLAGLAGIGDLVLTCTGRLSRNRALGIALGKGEGLAAWQAGTPMVAEGVRTAGAAHRLADLHAVEMPITREIHALLHEGKPAAAAIRDLLLRPLTSEEKSS